MRHIVYSTITQLFADAKLHVTGLPNATAGSENTVLSGLLNTVYAAAAIVAVVVIIVAGLYYTMSHGQPDQIKRAKNAILYAVIGLIVVIAAFAITWFVSNGVK